MGYIVNISCPCGLAESVRIGKGMTPESFFCEEEKIRYFIYDANQKIVIAVESLEQIALPSFIAEESVEASMDAGKPTTCPSCLKMSLVCKQMGLWD